MGTFFKKNNIGIVSEGSHPHQSMRKRVLYVFPLVKDNVEHPLSSSWIDDNNNNIYIIYYYGGGLCRVEVWEGCECVWSREWVVLW
jgi:hypothetical protein